MYKQLPIICFVMLLVLALPAEAETVISNSVSVSANSSDGSSSVSTSVISTVNGETTEYHYSSSSDSGEVAVQYSDEITAEVSSAESDEASRSVYLQLIERLQALIKLLQASS